MNEAQIMKAMVSDEESDAIEIVELESRHNQASIDPATSCSCECTSCSIIVHGEIEY